ncbi:MAG: hypothetical protein KC621_21240 [Myxococcales bacterium]|nr:hypothetical protein [Myxococcales bacterium]
MVVVTGTKRSGTSLWMRMLIEAGLPSIGEAFPTVWGDSIRDANPHGFFESRLRRGIWFATNPDPRTGAYLHAGPTRLHAVKVFVPGVIRTERAYLHRVVATMRDWRSYARSIADLEEQEARWAAKNPREGETAAEAEARVVARRPTLPAPVEWFLENFELVRDFSVRRYPIHFATYERLLAEPEATVGKVLAWIGTGEADRAAACVDPALRRSADRAPVASEAAIDAATAELFDSFYAAIHDGSSLPRDLLEPLNTTWAELSERYGRRRASELSEADQEPSS